MTHTFRHFYVRGYSKHGEVLGQNKAGEWILDANGKTEIIPEGHFYHRDPGGMLMLRDSVEFKRKYPNHPVAVEQLPSLNTPRYSILIDSSNHNVLILDGPFNPFDKKTWIIVKKVKWDPRKCEPNHGRPDRKVKLDEMNEQLKTLNQTIS